MSRRASCVLVAIADLAVVVVVVVDFTSEWCCRGRSGGCVTDICVQDLPKAVGATVGDEASGVLTPGTGGSGALMIMPDVSVVCGVDWPSVCFWTTSPNLDQTPVAVAAASG